MEEWKKIKGYSDYKVSSFGRVKSFKWNKERILKPVIGKCGYAFYRLWVNGVAKTIKGHRLVAIAFFENAENPNYVVDHINNIKDDNRLENLQMLTHRDNIIKEAKSNTGLSGVYKPKHTKKYRSIISVNKKQIHLGYYDTPEEAHNIYMKEKEKLKR